MTRFAEPEVISCTHCQTRYLRPVLLSFNTMWQIHYSDGGIKNGLQNTVINESRCTHCQGLIKNIQNLPVVEILSERPFWRNWFGKSHKYLYLPAPSFDVYFELFDNDVTANAKLNWAAKALQVFNQTYRLFGHERQIESEISAQYHQLINYILQRYTANASEEMTMLCADIYRQVGDFETSLHLYQNVDRKRFQHIVEPASSWCEQRITSLMEVDGQKNTTQSHHSSRDEV